MKYYNEYITFYILDEMVEVISFETTHGISTVVEINNKNYYMGDVEPDIATAVAAWQYAFDRCLTDDEFEKTINENT